MSYALFIFLNILLIQLPFSNEGCQYKTDVSQPTATTDNKYLTSSNADENKQKCFSLSNSDVQNGLCCYKNTGGQETCETATASSGDISCPEATNIANNCGMALFYQPVSKEICTEISLVNGYCCFVQTNTKGNACLRQDEIDEDNKDEITDYMKDYFRNKLKMDPDQEIKKVQCEGSLLKYYGFLMILLTVICL